MPENNKLEFFSDFRDKFFLFLAGIVSLATVIPAFLNTTADIFGFNQISTGYYIFIAVYFILPYVFYLLYCSIHDDVGYLRLLPEKYFTYLQEHKYLKTAADLIIPIIAFIYLIWPSVISNKFIACFFYLFPILIFLILIKVHWRKKELRREVLWIGFIIISIFSLFFFNLKKKEEKKSPNKQTFNFSVLQQDSAFNSYQTRDTLKKYFIELLDSVKQVSISNSTKASLNSYGQTVSAEQVVTLYYKDFRGLTAMREAADRIKNDLSSQNFIIKQESKCLREAANSLFTYEDSIIKSSDELKVYKAFFIQRYCTNLLDYGLSVQQSKIETISEKWAALLKVLQYKSLSWFFFLIVLGLCMWFKMLAEIQSIKNPAYSKLTLLNDNLSQVKSLIFLIVVLIIPWFRTIDAKNIELDKPFLNFNLNRLANGSYYPETPIVITPPANVSNDSTSIKINNVDTIAKINLDILKKIDTNVVDTKKLLKNLGRKTIGNPIDRADFDQEDK